MQANLQYRRGLVSLQFSSSGRSMDEERRNSLSGRTRINQVTGHSFRGSSDAGLKVANLVGLEFNAAALDNGHRKDRPE
jgi:hypothetical protein